MFEGRAHLMPALPGWEEVADHALDWAARQAADARRALPASRAVRGGSLGEPRPDDARLTP